MRSRRTLTRIDPQPRFAVMIDDVREVLCIDAGDQIKRYRCTTSARTGAMRRGLYSYAGRHGSGYALVCRYTHDGSPYYEIEYYTRELPAKEADT